MRIDRETLKRDTDDDPAQSATLPGICHNESADEGAQSIPAIG